VITETITETIADSAPDYRTIAENNFLSKASSLKPVLFDEVMPLTWAQTNACC
jgi:hypothetical protein